MRLGARTSLTLVAAGALVALAAGCESDEKNLERLRTEGSLARLSVLSWQQRNAAGQGNTDSLRAAENRLLVHEREMARFLDGR